jgi:hypothetical protein
VLERDDELVGVIVAGQEHASMVPDGPPLGILALGMCWATEDAADAAKSGAEPELRRGRGKKCGRGGSGRSSDGGTHKGQERVEDVNFAREAIVNNEGRLGR